MQFHGVLTLGTHQFMNPKVGLRFVWNGGGLDVRCVEWNGSQPILLFCRLYIKKQTPQAELSVSPFRRPIYFLAECFPPVYFPEILV